MGGWFPLRVCTVPVSMSESCGARGNCPQSGNKTARPNVGNLAGVMDAELTRPVSIAFMWKTTPTNVTSGAT